MSFYKFVKPIMRTVLTPTPPTPCWFSAATNFYNHYLYNYIHTVVWTSIKRGTSSVSRTLELFQRRQCGNLWDGVARILAFPSADTILNWTEPSMNYREIQHTISVFIIISTISFVYIYKTIYIIMYVLMKCVLLKVEYSERFTLVS